MLTLSGRASTASLGRWSVWLGRASPTSRPLGFPLASRYLTPDFVHQPVIAKPIRPKNAVTPHRELLEYSKGCDVARIDHGPHACERRATIKRRIDNAS